jgi:hypothetical protein
MSRFTILFAFLFNIITLSAQNTATVFGKISDVQTREPVELASVYIKNTNIAVETGLNGEYSIQIPINKSVTLTFSRTGYKEGTLVVQQLRVGERLQADVQLASLESASEVTIKASRLENGMIRQNLDEFKILPSTTGNLESVLPSIALGTSSGTGGELSSQYNVRGGNYDENLVYVNDFEIYRPQLIRAGQQEGLTFANMDLTRDLTFSSGGFQAKYGDKLSSVLDVHYKRPDSTRASVSGSFLGGTAHVEGSKKLGEYRRFRYLAGARYKTTQYLLGSLDVKGEYTPNFVDAQTYLTYDINRDWQVAALGNYNASKYNFRPREGASSFGLFNLALKLDTQFEGQERDDFTTYMGGVSATYLPDRKKNPMFLKFLASTFQIAENERFDIIGKYNLGLLETNLGSDNAGKVVQSLGDGVQHQYIRNYLTSNVSNMEHKGGIEVQKEHNSQSITSSHFVEWGAKIQHEDIVDKLNEWERIDSALYSLPFDTSRLLVKSVLKTRNALQSNRASFFAQDTYTFRDNDRYEMQLSGGVRGNYWDLNKEFVVSPRAQLQYKPLNWKQDMSFRLSTGLYSQSPFYRELRDPSGVVHTDVRAQKSAQIVAGMTYDFKAGRKNTPFRIITEAYYKQLWDLVSYDVDNVRVRYSGKNDTKGYVTGWDIRINGTFVPDAESWINLSFLRAREAIDGVTHLSTRLGYKDAVAVKDVPRPSDQLFTLGMFFQDYLPRNKNMRSHLQVTVGSGLPFGGPNENIIYRNPFRFIEYHRIDLGFSARLWDEKWLAAKPHHLLRFTRNTWASLEFFNLMNIANAASHTWIKTIYNNQFAVRNYLTSRRVNLRLRMDF